MKPKRTRIIQPSAENDSKKTTQHRLLKQQFQTTKASKISSPTLLGLNIIAQPKKTNPEEDVNPDTVTVTKAIDAAVRT